MFCVLKTQQDFIIIQIHTDFSGKFMSLGIFVFGHFSANSISAQASKYSTKPNSLKHEKKNLKIAHLKR